MTITAPHEPSTAAGVELDITPCRAASALSSTTSTSARSTTPPLPPSAIRQVWLSRKVVFFRGRHLNPDKHIAFAARFGEPTEGHPVIPGIKDHPQVLEIDYSAGRELYKNYGDVSSADAA